MKKKRYTFVTKLGKDIYVEMLDIGAGAVSHNLMCWLCRENKAVYDINPNWVFRPCWECQAKIGIYGVSETKKKWWQTIKDLLKREEG